MKTKKSLSILLPVCSLLLLGSCKGGDGFDIDGGDGQTTIYESQVTYVTDGKGGQCTGLTQGNPGQTVVIEVYPAIEHQLDKIYHNGVEVKPNAAGEYTIILVKGANEVKSTFTEHKEHHDPVITEPVTITLKTTMGQDNQKVMQRIIDGFKEYEPKITVNHMPLSGGYDDLTKQTVADFKTGEYGDLVLLYPDSVAEFISAGRAANVQQYVEDPEIGWTDDDLADIPEEYIAEGSRYSINGTYSLPFSKSTEAMYYDFELLSDLPIDVNNGKGITKNYLDNLTWEEFFGNLCPKLIEFDKAHPELSFINKTHQKGYGILGYDSSANLFITLAEQYGYDYTNLNKYGEGEALFDNPEMRALVKKYNEYGKNHYIFTKESIDNTYCNDLFNVGACLFSVGSTGGVKYQYPKDGTKTVYAAPIPYPAGKERKNILQGPSMCFLKHNKNLSTEWDEDRVKASWLFYKFATNLKNTADWAVNTNYMPIRNTVYGTQEYLALSNPDLHPVESKDALIARSNKLCKELSNYFYTSPVFKGSGTARTEVEKLMGLAIKPSTTEAQIDEAFTKALEATKKMM